MENVAGKHGGALPIADAFEELAAATVLARGPVPIKASKGRTRLLKVVDKSGTVVGVTTHGKVLEGAARIAEIEIAVQEDTRPNVILCAECKSPREPVPTGPLPKWCKPCAEKRTREKERARHAANRDKELARGRARRAANPEKKKEQLKAWIAANPKRAKEIADKSRRKYSDKQKAARAAGVATPKTEEQRKKLREYRRKWEKAHPEKKREKNRKYSARKRAKRDASA